MLAVPEGAPKEYPCNLCQYYTKDEKCLAIHQPGCPLREMFGLKMIEKIIIYFKYFHYLSLDKSYNPSSKECLHLLCIDSLIPVFHNA